jgi:hypothetical protein
VLSVVGVRWEWGEEGVNMDGYRASQPRNTEEQQLWGMYDTWVSGSDVNSFCCYGLVYLLDSW